MFYISVCFGGFMAILGMIVCDKVYFTRKHKKIKDEEMPIFKYKGCLYTEKEFEKILSKPLDKP